jgi:hypothetical protein
MSPSVYVIGADNAEEALSATGIPEVHVPEAQGHTRGATGPYPYRDHLLIPWQVILVELLAYHFG